jgi:phage baseplate assembly protein W
VSWDLALAKGDLVISGSKDFSGISGTDLLNQRISIRLRLHRGEWVYDEGDTLGSQLHQLVGAPQQQVVQVATAYVRNALREMGDEISVDSVEAQTPTERTVTLAVYYRVLDDPGAGGEQNAEIVDVTIGGTA